MMTRLLFVSAFLKRIAETLGRLSAWLIVALILVIMTDVTLRHWFVIGSTKLQELEWHLHGALFLLALGWAYSRDAHVRIELASERFSPRTKAWVELIGCSIFLLPYVAAVIWFGIDYVGYSLEYNEASPSATGLPDRWIIKATIPIGFLTLGFVAIARMLEAIVFLFGPDTLHGQTHFAGRYPTDETAEEETA